MTLLDSFSKIYGFLSSCVKLKPSTTTMISTITSRIENSFARYFYNKWRFIFLQALTRLSII